MGTQEIIGTTLNSSTARSIRVCAQVSCFPTLNLFPAVNVLYNIPFISFLHKPGVQHGWCHNHI